MSFNIGDRVRIISVGWGISDTSLIGKEFIIRFADSDPFSIKLEGSPYIWNESLLELVEDDDVIQVGDVLIPLPFEETGLVGSPTNRRFQDELLSFGRVTVQDIKEDAIGRLVLSLKEFGSRQFFVQRFRKDGVPNPNLKYIKVIRKIREMKQRRAKLGYKY